MKAYLVSCFLIAVGAGAASDYQVTAGKHCSGEPIDHFFKADDCKNDGVESKYSQHLGWPIPFPNNDKDNNIELFKKFKKEELERCAKMCNDHPDCCGFTSYESANDVDPSTPGFKVFKCSFWRKGDLSKGVSAPEYSCHRKKSKKTGKCKKDVCGQDDGEDGEEVEILLQIPKQCPRQIPVEEVRRRTIDVPVPVPEIITQDVPCHVPTPVQVPVPVTQTVHVRVPTPNVVERRIPTPVTVQVQVPVPVPTPVENPIPCPVPHTIQQPVPVPVFVDRVVDVPVPVPVPMQMPHPTAHMIAPQYAEPALAYDYGQPNIAGLGALSGVGVAGPAMLPF